MAYKNVLVDETPCNILPGGIAGEAITAGDLVYLDSDGAWQLADAVANTATTRKDALGVAWKDAQANEFMSPARIARIRDTTASLTIGQKIYLSSTAGAYTVTEPTTDIRQVVGIAIKSDEILFAIGGASGAPVDVGGDMNADSLTLVSTLDVGTNATVGGTLGVTGATTLTGGIADGTNVSAGTTTGTIYATTTSEKIGFHGVAGTSQRAGASQAAVTATAVTAVLTTASITTTPHGFATGTQADAIVARVNQLVTDMGNVETLLNELRAALVAKGLISGAA